jgi:very-short-patch-repair endonuclease
MKTCPVCNETFDVGRVYSNHVRCKHKPQTFTPEGLQKLKDVAIRVNAKRLGYEGTKYATQQCVNCHKTIVEATTQMQYCKDKACQSVAHSFGGKKVWQMHRQKLIKALKEMPRSEAWIASQGRTDHPNQKRFFTSKGEEALKLLIKQRLPQFKWSSGGLHNIGNGLRKSLDIYCKDIKVIVEYDGIYHWKNVYGNLEDVQKKDRQLEQFCSDNGWKLIRVNEQTYKKVPLIVETIINMILNHTQLPSVVKLYLIPEINSL